MWIETTCEELDADAAVGGFRKRRPQGVEDGSVHTGNRQLDPPLATGDELDQLCRHPQLRGQRMMMFHMALAWPPRGALRRRETLPEAATLAAVHADGGPTRKVLEPDH